MKLSFHGAAKCVTGTKHLIELKNGNKLLLDCGLFQGSGQQTDELNQNWGFEPSSIRHLVLSHAHIDHSGLIPKLVRDGFQGKILCTQATFDLCKILLIDSAKIQKEDLAFVNKRRKAKGQSLLKELYSEEDVFVALRQFVPCEYDQDILIDENFTLLFTEAGHIIGSAVVNLEINENGKTKRLTFTGDIGRYNDSILRSPSAFPQADFIICESTYGNTLHPNAEITTNDLLKEIVHTCLKKKGKLIIPAFSVGRTQQLVYALNQLETAGVLPPIDFYVDSPLSIEATHVTMEHAECFNKRLLQYMQKDPSPFEFKRLHYIKQVEESKGLNMLKHPAVIISASGMAEAGRVKHHIANNIEDERNTIMIVGFCEENTLGARLVNGASEVKIFGELKKVKASIKKVSSLSAHGDYEDLSQFLVCQDPKKVEKVFLVHGRENVIYDFKNKLLKKGFYEVETPDLHQEYNL